MFENSDTTQIKKALKAEFNHPFSVRRDRGTASHWIQIRWTDGPTEKSVREFTAKFNDTSRDDMMTDLWCGSQYTSESREISVEFYNWAVKQIEEEFGIKLKVSISEYPDGKKIHRSAYISNENDIIVENDNPDYSQRYASNKVNRKLFETDARGLKLN